MNNLCLFSKLLSDYALEIIVKICRISCFLETKNAVPQRPLNSSNIRISAGRTKGMIHSMYYIH